MKQLFLLYQKAIIAFCLLIFPCLEITAQDPTAGVEFHRTVSVGSESGEKVPVTKILQVLEQKHAVNFGYVDKTFAGKSIDPDQVKSDGDLESCLRELLDPLSLDYKEIKDDFYVILAKDEKAVVFREPKTEVFEAGFPMDMPLFPKRRSTNLTEASPAALDKVISGQ